MNNLRELYQEVIIDHGRCPRNFGKLDCFTHQAEGFNPLCGDKITIYLSIKDEIIQEARFTGVGCAISTASASLMLETLKGKKCEQAIELFEKFHHLITHEDKINDEQLIKLSVLAGVREYPTRVKCATLAWHTLIAALKQFPKAISTEENS